MKKPKRKIVFIGAAIGAAAIATVIGLMFYGKNHQFKLSVGGHEISQAEYINYMKSVEYDTKVQIQQEFGVQYTDGFWEEQYGDRYGYEILEENTIELIKYMHAVYDVAVEYGDIEDGSYQALEERWKNENKERSEKIANGQVVYGVKSYTFSMYQQYETSIFKETYCNDKTREGMDLTEDEIVEYYNSNEWIFDGSEDNADLETARVAVVRELREVKYDNMIAQAVENTQVEGDMSAVAQFTLKNMQ